MSSKRAEGRKPVSSAKKKKEKPPAPVKGSAGDYLKLKVTLAKRIQSLVARNIERIFLVDYAPKIQCAMQGKERNCVIYLPDPDGEGTAAVYAAALSSQLNAYLISQNYKVTSQGRLSGSNQVILLVSW